MIIPTSPQVQIRDHVPASLLVVAPAGCGKTEALALRVAGQLGRKSLGRGQRILVVTFTNRSRENLAERLRSHLSESELQRQVTVSNFHGLSARLIRAHGNVIGVDDSIEMPESDWVSEMCRVRGLSFAASSAAQEALRMAKQQCLDDTGVTRELQRQGNSHALDIEMERRQKNILTYDDLPRLAELILSVPGVARLYRNHFRYVIVDEFQDLTPQQLRIIRSFALERTTYAGDLAQGIYTFAGADADYILDEVEREVSCKVEFADSHRSSPSVLAMVNSLAEGVGGQLLNCAQPDKWPAKGLAGRLHFDNVHEEAEWVTMFAEGVLDRAPNHRVGVVGRTKSRVRFMNESIAASAMPHFRWDDPVVDPVGAQVLRAAIKRINLRRFAGSNGGLRYLRTLVQPDAFQDPDTRACIIDGLSWAYDLLSDGQSPQEILDRVKVGEGRTILNSAGVHVLTGHVGKGQQFDWVIVCGLEEGVIPDFRALTDFEVTEELRILSVMISRARHGVILTSSATVPSQAGRVVTREPSRFLRFFEDVPECFRDNAAIRAWLRAANWSVLRTV